jgi:hypothetical protein
MSSRSQEKSNCPHHQGQEVDIERNLYRQILLNEPFSSWSLFHSITTQVQAPLLVTFQFPPFGPHFRVVVPWSLEGPIPEPVYSCDSRPFTGEGMKMMVVLLCL